MNSYDEIKNLLKKSRMIAQTRYPSLSEGISEIKNKYLITEEDDVIDDDSQIQNYDVAKSIESQIEDDEDSKRDEMQQAYRISGGILVINADEKKDLELTTDEKTSFQETMDEFVEEVSDLANFGKLNIYSNNVEWSGKIVDLDIEFFYTIGESNGIYMTGEMIKVDENFLDTINKLQSYYQKFKSKWAKILASRKKTKEKKIDSNEPQG
jgi:hypothetical protein